MTGRLCGRGLGGGGTQHDASLASVFASTSSADACQGRLEIVLDYFQSCQSDEWWEQLNISHVCQVELSPRISSIYENVRNFTVFEKKKSFDYLPLGEILSVCFTADKIERNCHAAFSV